MIIMKLDNLSPTVLSAIITASAIFLGPILAALINNRRKKYDNQAQTLIVQNCRSQEQQDLLKSVQREVNAWLQEALISTTQISLDKQLQPEQVKPSLNIKSGRKFPEPLPDSTSILDVFERPEIAGRLLILGEPGSGKTTTLYNLAKGLVCRAEKDVSEPIPIILDLSSWNDNHGLFSDWLVKELKQKMGVREKLGEKWVSEKQVLPLLDGLDEVNPSHLASCVSKINEWLSSESRPKYLVVCCRREGYEKIIRGSWKGKRSNQSNKRRLNLNGAILINPLTDQKIEEYLTSLDRIDFLKTLQKKPDLWNLLRVPLWLNISLMTYENINFADKKSVSSSQTLEELLLDAYVNRMLSRDLPKDASFKNYIYPKDSTVKEWLASIAMNIEGSKFLIEGIQPSWLSPGTQVRTYKLMIFLIYWTIIGLGAWLLVTLAFLDSGVGKLESLNYGLRNGVFAGLVGSLTVVLREDLTNIELAEALEFSWKSFSKIFIFCTLGALSISIISGIFMKDLFHVKDMTLWLRSGLYLGLFSGVTFGLYNSFKAINLDIKEVPNQGIRRTAKNAFEVTVCFSIAFGLFSGIFFFFSSNLSNLGILLGIILGMMSGPIYGLVSARGRSCIRHFALRFTLFQAKLSPWNYSVFLDYCRERLLIRRVGGSYYFIHKEFQRYFANL